jgi:acyl carrier protein
MYDTIRRILRENRQIGSKVDRLTPHDDLYAAGLASFDTVKLMLALEEAFDIEFPESLLRRQTFASMSDIERSIRQIQETSKKLGQKL